MLSKFYQSSIEGVRIGRACRIGSAIARLFLLLCCSSAHADWQFSRWGMTPDQLVQASGGAAHLEAIPPGAGESETIEAVGTLVSGELGFNVSYQFHDRRALTRVYLSLTRGECFRAWDALKGKYGEPLYNSGDPILATADWRSDAENMKIEIMSGTNVCRIMYAPLRTGDGVGL